MAGQGLGTAGEFTVEISEATLLRTNGVLRLGDKPFSGVLVERYPDRHLKSLAQYVDGRQHGIAESWFSNGATDEIRHYQHGWKDGEHRGWWSNGKPRFVFQFKDQVYEGTCQEWYENGQPYRVNHYVAGEEVGRQQLWYEDGKILANYVVKDGRRYGLTGAMGCISVTK